MVFVRYALPGETVKVRVVGDHGSYWHADVVEVIEPSPDRIDSLCPIAGVDGAGCCDLAFAEPDATRRLKGAVVANQLARLGGYQWRDEDSAAAEPVGDVGATGWRTRVRLDTSGEGRAGFHRYHSSELVTELNCAQLPAGMLDGLNDWVWPPGAQLHVAVDDDGDRHVVQSGPRTGRKTSTQVVEGTLRGGAAGRGADLAGAGDRVLAGAPRRRPGLQRAGGRLGAARRRHDGVGFVRRGRGFRGGTGGGRRRAREASSPSTRPAGRRGRRATALADLGWVSVVTDSVRRALGRQAERADVAVLDPPRSGAGREVIDLLAAAEVPRVIHIGCEAASFARDVGLYLGHGYAVEELAGVRLVPADAPRRVRGSAHPLASRAPFRRKCAIRIRRAICGEMPLQPSVPVAEQRAQSPCDDRRQQAQRRAECERDAIAHKGFPVTARVETLRSWRH